MLSVKECHRGVSFGSDENPGGLFRGDSMGVKMFLVFLGESNVGMNSNEFKGLLALQKSTKKCKIELFGPWCRALPGKSVELFQYIYILFVAISADITAS